MQASITILLENVLKHMATVKRLPADQHHRFRLAFDHVTTAVALLRANL